MAAIEWHAEALPCRQLHVEATASRHGKPLTVTVDGAVVATGRGAIDWTGDAFFGTQRVVVRVAPDPDARTVFDWEPGAAVALTGPYGARTGAVPLHVHVDTACPIGDFAWTLTTPGTDGTNTTVEVGGRADADVSVFVPPGVAAVDVDLRWKGWSVATARHVIGVGPACVDADDDGACADTWDGPADCDDADPTVRPGRPDVRGDNKDNDCDGHVAGDADGDGYESSIGAPISSGGVAFDCDDTNPAVHPGAPEIDDGLDDDCDGTLVGEHPLAWLVTRAGDRLIAESSATTGVAVAITPLRTGAGRRAWLVVADTGSASMGGHSDVDRVGYVVIATPPDGERLVLRLDLGTAAFGRRRDANGDEVENPPEIVISDDLITPKVVLDGLVAGAVRYRWVGDALVASEPAH